MSTRNEGTAHMNISGNRKMKEAIATPTAHQLGLFNLHSASSSNARRSKVQQILNNPLLHLSLSTVIDQADHDSVPTDIRNLVEEIIRSNTIHYEHLRQELEGLMGKTANKLKEKEMELEQKVAENAELERVMMQYRAEVERLQVTVRYLEQEVMNAQGRTGLQEGMATSLCSETGKEDEPMFTEVRLECRNCKREMATVMLWPCRHVCLCRRCNADVRIVFCPVCSLMKTGSLEVYISPADQY